MRKANLTITPSIIAALAIAVLLTVGFGPGVSANPTVELNRSPFGDACRNVKFKFKNLHKSHDVIDVKDVEYFNRANGKWQTEQLKNRPGMAGFICFYGEICTTEDEDLRDSEGEQITKIRFHYKFKKAGRNLTSWSKKVVSRIFEPIDPVCNANRIYGTGQAWTIGEQ